MTQSCPMARPTHRTHADPSERGSRVDQRGCRRPNASSDAGVPAARRWRGLRDYACTQYRGWRRSGLTQPRDPDPHPPQPRSGRSCRRHEAGSGLAHPHRWPIIPNSLTGAQYLLADPRWWCTDDGPKPALVGCQQEAGDCPFKRPRRVDGSLASMARTRARPWAMTRSVTSAGSFTADSARSRLQCMPQA